MEGAPARKPISAELKELFDADQADRMTVHGKWDDAILSQRMAENDTVRLKRAREIYEEYIAGTVNLSSDQLVQLAFLFQHSSDSDDYRKAHELGNAAGEEGLWIAAAAEDRWLLSRGEKQKWGTQFRHNEQAPMLSDDESGITDAMREEREIPPRANQLVEHLKHLNSED